ncbi:hypothetical protein BGZ83_001235 [Gryganskiella cystojenkinii]|nr:hypothetical protein BGZ83_001235 [Gryganskiella cystojenkinii]
MAELTLFCLVKGQQTAFSVDIMSTKTVDHLKKNINNELKLGTPSKDLTLWKVPDGTSAEKMGDVLSSLNDKNKLNPLLPLRSLFPQGAAEGVVHIVVQEPEQGAMKRPLDDLDPTPVLKHFKPNATVHTGARRYVYYADQTERSQDLMKNIKRGFFPRVYGARASGKSSRMIDVMTALNAQGFECIYLSLDAIDIRTLDDFWSSIGRYLKRLHYKLEINSFQDFLDAFSADEDEDRKRVVLFVDEFDKLHVDSASDALSSFLEVVRFVKNNPTATVIQSIVAIGTFAILHLNQMHQQLSPYNVSDNVRNKSLSMEQVQDLFDEFANDRHITIAGDVIEEVFAKTNGHAGLVNVCGVAMDAGLTDLKGCKRFEIEHWGPIENGLLTDMANYGTFDRLLTDLKSSKQVSAMSHYRSYYLGNPSDQTVLIQSPDILNISKYLAALGVLNPGSNEKGFTIASPLMDSFIRQKAIYAVFPSAPKIPIPRRQDSSFDILQIVKSSLEFFDKKLIAEAGELSHKKALVPVENVRNRQVPRESVYEAELLRVFQVWLCSGNDIRVVNQYHIKGIRPFNNSYCDLVVGPEDGAIPIELLVTATPQEVQEHIERTVRYKKKLQASQAWVIHFTRQDNYLQDPLWPSYETLHGDVSMIHVWHNREFTEVRLSAKWKGRDGQITMIENESVLQ